MTRASGCWRQLHSAPESGNRYMSGAYILRPLLGLLDKASWPYHADWYDLHLSEPEGHQRYNVVDLF